MAKRTHRVDDASVATIEHEVQGLRERMTSIARELDRRRHALFDVRRQLRRHRLALSVAAIVVVVIGWRLWHVRLRHREMRLHLR
jgi:hypothetical protein